MHCILSGGGLTPNRKLRCFKEKFFLPVYVLRDLFKGKYLAGLDQLFQQGELLFSAPCEKLRNSYEWKEFRDSLYKIDWCPYIHDICICPVCGRCNMKLIVQVIPSDEAAVMEISIIDNGIGFESIPEIQNVQPSEQDAHTLVGLRNLDKRLELLFGPDACLRIDSIPEKCTTISFKVPIRTEEG